MRRAIQLTVVARLNGPNPTGIDTPYISRRAPAAYCWPFVNPREKPKPEEEKR
jgi:hypothetical protein